jgi:hypothetical protein
LWVAEDVEGVFLTRGVAVAAPAELEAEGSKVVEQRGVSGSLSISSRKAGP